MHLQPRTGIYCLANDAVLDWVIALLESIRSFEPSRELIVIPFDDNIARLSRLSAQYNFRFLSDDGLVTLDRLAADLNPGVKVSWHHNWRKLAAFWGPLDCFLYLDADIVVLSRLDELLGTFLRSGYDFMYFDMNLDSVYKPGAFREMMVKEHSAAGFNAGAFVSKKGVVSMDVIRVLAREAAPVRVNFVSSGDQSFLNYLVDMKGLSKQRYCHLAPYASCSNWAKLAPIGLSEGVYRLCNSAHDDSGKTLSFLHWAGFKQGPLMPHRKLFLHFRHMGKPQIVRFAHYGLDTVCYGLGIIRLLWAWFWR